MNSEGNRVDSAAEGFPWYALQVWSRREAIIANHLEGQGLECFLPIYRSTRQWSDRKKEVEQPLFPGSKIARWLSIVIRRAILTP